jgi:hypothetical protein
MLLFLLLILLLLIRLLLLLLLILLLLLFLHLHNHRPPRGVQPHLLRLRGRRFISAWERRFIFARGRR